MYMPFDQVQYTGEKFRQELRGKLGVISARVGGEKASYVVDFGDAAYILHETLLDRFKAHTKEDVSKAEREIYLRRKPKNDE